MSLRGKLTPGTAEHTNVASAKHDADKRFFAAGAVSQPQVKVALPLESPVPDVRQIRNAYGERQQTFIRETNRMKEVRGSELTNHLKRSQARLNLRFVGNGTRVLKSGERIQKWRLAKSKANVFRETPTLGAWDSELFSYHCTAADQRDIANFVSAAFERITGCKVLGLAMHCDTDNLHFDVWATDVDEAGVVFGRQGAWWLGDGAAVLLRYDVDGFPADPDVLSSVRTMVERDRKKPGFLCHRNLELGLAIDRWMRAWAKRRGLSAERAVRKEKYAAYQRAKIAATRALNDHARTHPGKSDRATLEVLKSELEATRHRAEAAETTIRDLTAKLAAHEKKSAAIERDTARRRLAASEKLHGHIEQAQQPRKQP